MGLFNWFKKKPKKEEEDSLKIAGNKAAVVSVKVRKEVSRLTLKEAEAVLGEIQVFLDEQKKVKAMNAACRLLSKGSYEQAVEAFQKIMALLPQNKGFCENQIGAACFFLEKYEEAILHYLLSLQHDFDVAILDYNVWEAAQEYYKMANDAALVKVYVERFPEGDAATEAQKLLKEVIL